MATGIRRVEDTRGVDGSVEDQGADDISRAMSQAQYRSACHGYLGRIGKISTGEREYSSIDHDITRVGVGAGEGLGTAASLGQTDTA